MALTVDTFKPGSMNVQQLFPNQRFNESTKVHNVEFFKKS